MQTTDFYAKISFVLQVWAIEFVTSAIEFVHLAIEFVSLAIEFVHLAIEFVSLAIKFVHLSIEFVSFAIEFVALARKFIMTEYRLQETSHPSLDKSFSPWRATLEMQGSSWSW